MSRNGAKNTKWKGKRTKRPTRHPREVTSPAFVPAARPIYQLWLGPSYLDPANTVWCPHWHGVTTPEDQVQYDAAERRAMLDWYRHNILEGFKRPRKLKHVRQPRLSRISQKLARVLHQVRKGPRNLKIVKCGKPRILILREIRRGRADLNLNHVRQPSPSRVSHQRIACSNKLKNPTTDTTARELSESSRARSTRQEPHTAQAHQSTPTSLHTTPIASIVDHLRVNMQHECCIPSPQKWYRYDKNGTWQSTIDRN